MVQIQPTQSRPNTSLRAANDGYAVLLKFVSRRIEVGLVVCCSLDLNESTDCRRWYSFKASQRRVIATGSRCLEPFVSETLAR